MRKLTGVVSTRAHRVARCVPAGSPREEIWLDPRYAETLRVILMSVTDADGTGTKVPMTLVRTATGDEFLVEESPTEILEGGKE